MTRLLQNLKHTSNRLTSIFSLRNNQFMMMETLIVALIALDHDLRLQSVLLVLHVQTWNLILQISLCTLSSLGNQ